MSIDLIKKFLKNINFFYYVSYSYAIFQLNHQKCFSYWFNGRKIIKSYDRKTTLTKFIIQYQLMEILAFIVSLNSSSSIVCWINLQFGCKIQLKCWCKKRICLNGLFWIRSFGCWSIRIITLAFKIIQPILSSLHMVWTLWISFHYYDLIRRLIFGFCRISLLNICW